MILTITFPSFVKANNEDGSTPKYRHAGTCTSQEKINNKRLFIVIYASDKIEKGLVKISKDGENIGEIYEARVLIEKSIPDLQGILMFNLDRWDEDKQQWSHLYSPELTVDTTKDVQLMTNLTTYDTEIEKEIKLKDLKFTCYTDVI